MKIGLVGFGYWGKILYKNLTSMKHDVIVCEKQNVPEDIASVKNYVDLDVDKVFVAVPCKEHYEICKHFLNKGVPVFCEKPLTFTLDESVELYNTATVNDTTLFVDWVFMFNQQVNKIRSIAKTNQLGALKSVSMRRMNKGPVRHDVNALYDLSSHDLSILFHIIGLNASVTKVCSSSYKANKQSVQDDSFFAVYDIDNTICTIHSSWEHAVKDRGCVFEFENGVILWDDITQTLTIEGKPFVFHEKELPLVNSINAFLHTEPEKLQYQKNLTLKIMETLDYEIQ